MCDHVQKSGRFQEYEIPKSWDAGDVMDFLNSLLSDESTHASVELCKEGDTIIVVVWYRAIPGTPST